MVKKTVVLSALVLLCMIGAPKVNARRGRHYYHDNNVGARIGAGLMFGLLPAIAGAASGYDAYPPYGPFYRPYGYGPFGFYGW